MQIYKISDVYEDDIDTEDLPDDNKGGDCFSTAGRLVLNQLFSNDEGKVLVHGHVLGQGNIEGVRYVHAWVEQDDMVLDFSNDNDIQLPKELYYKLGRIDEGSLKKYTPEEVREKVVETENWGPWDI